MAKIDKRKCTVGKKQMSRIIKIIAFILDLGIAYVLGGLIVFLAGLILYWGSITIGHYFPNSRENITFLLKYLDFALKVFLIFLIFLYFKILPKLFGKTFGKKILKIKNK